MKNLERFKKAIRWEPTDRILTYDYLDNRQILVEYGGFDGSREYSFEELIDLAAVISTIPARASSLLSPNWSIIFSRLALEPTTVSQSPTSSIVNPNDTII